MKTHCSAALPDNDPTISISLISGRVIRLRRSELAACEMVARLLRRADHEARPASRVPNPDRTTVEAKASQ
jgi:hypothetical protein